MGAYRKPCGPWNHHVTYGVHRAVVSRWGTFRRFCSTEPRFMDSIERFWSNFAIGRSFSHRIKVRKIEICEFWVEIPMDCIGRQQWIVEDFRGFSIENGCFRSVCWQRAEFWYRKWSQITLDIPAHAWEAIRRDRGRFRSENLGFPDFSRPRPGKSIINSVTYCSWI